MKTQLTQDLKSAKNQLSYVNEALASNLENWERKEYEAVKADLIENINSLEYRLATCF
jgi:hypothetical protein